MADADAQGVVQGVEHRRRGRYSGRACEVTVMLKDAIPKVHFP